MALFSEIYGVYYHLVARILQDAPLRRSDIQTLVSNSGFGESVLHLIPKLLDEGTWPLLEERDGLYHATLHSAPTIPVTLLEKRWLKAVLTDPRARLFLQDAVIDRLQDALGGVSPLFDLSSFRYFDRHLDGDDYQSDAYVHHFRQVMSALHQQRVIRLTYQAGPRGKELRFSRGDYLPLKLEYSEKDDKFRAHCLRIRRGKATDSVVINLGRIRSAAPSDQRLDVSLPDAPFTHNRCDEPVVVEVRRERNAIERLLVEFSAFEKQSTLDEETGTVTVRIWYHKADETEVLIRLLSFGPVVKVLAPEGFVRQIKQRVTAQNKLLFNEKQA